MHPSSHIKLLLHCGHDALVDRSLIQAFYTETVINCAQGCDPAINTWIERKTPGQEIALK